MRRRHFPLLSRTSLGRHLTGALKMFEVCKVDEWKFGSTVTKLGGDVECLQKIVLLPLTRELCNKNNKLSVTINPFIKYLFPLRDISLASILHYFFFGFAWSRTTTLSHRLTFPHCLESLSNYYFFVLCYQRVSATHTHNIFSGFCLWEFAELKINNFMTCENERSWNG